MAWSKDFSEIVSSGVWNYLPQSFVSNEDSVIYKFMMAISCAVDTENIRQDIRNEEKLVVNASDWVLTDASKYFGVYEFPMEDSESLAIRASTYWKSFEGGGNKNSIKRVIYDFIGEGAFGYEGWSETNRIIINEPRLSGLISYWNDVSSGSTSYWGSTYNGLEIGYWSSLEGEIYGAEIIIKLVSGTTSNSIQNRDYYQYWNQEEKKVLLKQVVDEVRPLGIRYKITLQPIVI